MIFLQTLGDIADGGALGALLALGMFMLFIVLLLYVFAAIAIMFIARKTNKVK